MILKSTKKRLRSFEEEYFTEVYVDREKEGSVIFRYHLKKIFEKAPQAQNILDIGCAYGQFLALCDQKGLTTYGMDVSVYAVEQARKQTQAKLAVFDASQAPWPYQAHSFDIVTIFDVIEHVKDASFLLSEAYRVLRPGGWVYATTPNNQGRLGKFLERFMPDDPTHINKKNASGWKKELSKVGFSHIDIQGIIFHGLPPSPKFRAFLERYKIPTTVSPITFPLKLFTGTLFIFGRKP